MMKRILALLMLLSASALVQAGPPPAVQAVDPWIREAPPGMPMMAGFVTLKNRGSAPVALISAEGPDFGQIELHRSITENGVARMVPQERIVIPPGGETRLEPGSYHLMLMQPRRALRAGDSARILLHFDDGTTLALAFPVRSDRDGMSDMSGMHHHH